jgi:hypothetical protein
MLVATVTQPRSPARATISASSRSWRAFSSLKEMFFSCRSFARCSDAPTDRVPTSTGWPRALRSTMVSTTACHLAAAEPK